MGDIDSNGVWFWDENDIFAPVQTCLNLGSAVLSETLGEMRTDLASVVAGKPAARLMAKTSRTQQNGGASFGMPAGWADATGSGQSGDPDAFSFSNTAGFIGLVAQRPGLFRISGSIALESQTPNAAGYQQARIITFTPGPTPALGAEVVLGQRVPPMGMSNSFNQVCTAEATVRLATGDGLAVQVRHTHGNTTYIAVASRISLEYVGS